MGCDEVLRRNRLPGKKIRGQESGKVEGGMADLQTRLDVEKDKSPNEVKGGHLG